MRSSQRRSANTPTYKSGKATGNSQTGKPMRSNTLTQVRTHSQSFTKQIARNNHTQLSSKQGNDDTAAHMPNSHLFEAANIQYDTNESHHTCSPVYTQNEFIDTIQDEFALGESSLQDTLPQCKKTRRYISISASSLVSYIICIYTHTYMHMHTVDRLIYTNE